VTTPLLQVIETQVIRSCLGFVIIPQITQYKEFYSPSPTSDFILLIIIPVKYSLNIQQYTSIKTLKNPHLAG